MTREVKLLVKDHPVCGRPTAIEGIGPIGAMSLYATLGSGEACSQGREASACVRADTTAVQQRRHALLREG